MSKETDIHVIVYNEISPTSNMIMIRDWPEPKTQERHIKHTPNAGSVCVWCAIGVPLVWVRCAFCTGLVRVWYRFVLGDETGSQIPHIEYRLAKRRLFCDHVRLFRGKFSRVNWNVLASLISRLQPTIDNTLSKCLVVNNVASQQSTLVRQYGTSVLYF